MKRWKRGLVWTGTLDELNSNDAGKLARGLGKFTRPDLPKPIAKRRTNMLQRVVLSIFIVWSLAMICAAVLYLIVDAITSL